MQRPIVYFDTDRFGQSFSQKALYQSIGAAADSRPGVFEDALKKQKSEDYPIVFHLHRQSRLIQEMPRNEDVRGAVQAVLDAASAFVDIGGKIVWSRDLIMPKDGPAARLQDDFNAHMTELADVIHLTSWRDFEALSERVPIPFEKATVISPGHSIGRFPQWPGPAARQRLDIDRDVFVFLTFDEHASADAFESEISAFEELDQENTLLLAVSGATGAEGNTKATDRTRVIECSNFDEDLGLYLAAADAIIVSQSATFGAEDALTCASASLGVIGLDNPDLTDVYTDRKNALLYPEADEYAPIRSIRIALNEGRGIWSERGASAGHVARCRDWSVAARQWIAIYRSLSGLPRAGTMERGAQIEVVGQ